MNDDAYYKPAKVLDTLPNGFTHTERGIEIKLLKKIFIPDHADLFDDMRLTFEVTVQASQHNGRELEGLEDMLVGMSKQGKVYWMGICITTRPFHGITLVHKKTRFCFQ